MGFSFRLGDPFLRDKWIFNIDPPYYLWCDEGWDGRWRACRKQGNAENLLWVNQCFPSWGWLYLTSIWPAFDRDWSNTFEHHRKDGNDWPESWFLPMNDRKCEWMKFHISLVFTAFYSSLWQTKIGRSSNASAYCVQRPLLASRWSGQILSWCNFWLRPWHVERKSSPDEVGCLSSVLSEVIWAITTMAMTGSWNLSTQYLLGLGYEQARIWPALKIWMPCSIGRDLTDLICEQVVQDKFL